MALKLSETVRNKVLDAIETTVGTQPWSTWFHSAAEHLPYTDNYRFQVWTRAADDTLVEASGILSGHLLACGLDHTFSFLFELEEKVWDQLLEHAVSEDLLCVTTEPVG
jgi:hypothetical protein